MNKHSYKAKNFSDMFNDTNTLGQEIWDYLNTEEIWIRLELTTQLRHPAVEGIGDKLLEKFGSVLNKGNPKFDRYKQMIGHMVKEIMEKHGYIIWQKGVRCRKKTELFVFATKYCKEEEYLKLVNNN